MIIIPRHIQAYPVNGTHRNMHRRRPTEKRRSNDGLGSRATQSCTRTPRGHHRDITRTQRNGKLHYVELTDSYTGEAETGNTFYNGTWETCSGNFAYFYIYLYQLLYTYFCSMVSWSQRRKNVPPPNGSKKLITISVTYFSATKPRCTLNTSTGASHSLVAHLNSSNTETRETPPQPWLKTTPPRT